MAYLRGLTIKASEPARLADFYRAVFELNTVSEDPNLIRLSDGVLTLALLKESNDVFIGIHASGFEVESLDSVKQKADGRSRLAAQRFPGDGSG